MGITTVLQNNPWFVTSQRRDEARIRLICFPFAGGNSSTYHAWYQFLPPSIEVIAIQLPGRGSRFRESPFTDMRHLVDALLPHFSSLGDIPFVLFGHSLGALIAYEVALGLRILQQTGPLRLYVSASAAPHVFRIKEQLHNLPDQALLERLGEMQGVPSEVLDHEELMELILPTIRADLGLAEAYKSRRKGRLNLGIVAFQGMADREVEPTDVVQWSEYCYDDFAVHTLPGDHFFINSQRDQLLQLIAQDIDYSVLRGLG
jgi:surfactin synthase thioesterase subunit